MAEIRNARGNVREAIAALQVPGVLRKTKSWLMALLATWLSAGSNPESGGSGMTLSAIELWISAISWML